MEEGSNAGRSEGPRPGSFAARHSSQGAVQDDVVLDQLIALSLTTRERGALERVVARASDSATLSDSEQADRVH